MNLMLDTDAAGVTVAEASAAAGFVALSKFVIANEMTGEIKKAFVERPHLVDDADGYVCMDVISPDNSDEIWLITFWRDEESFRVRHRSHEYHESQRGIPKDLKLAPKSASVRYFERVSSRSGA